MDTDPESNTGLTTAQVLLFLLFAFAAIAACVASVIVRDGL
jgi:hypothetical protein